MNRIWNPLMLMLMLVCGALGAAEIHMPEDFSATAAPERGSWRQWGRMPLTYAAARGRVDLALRRQGWEKRKTVDFDRVQWKTLELWTRGEERILVQYWRIEVALTGVAWGNLTEEKNHERQNHI